MGPASCARSATWTGGRSKPPTRRREWLAQVRRAQEAGLSVVEPSYAVWRVKDTEVSTLWGRAPAEQIGGSLSGVHCGGPGPFAVQVGDSANDAADFRRQYTLRVTTGPEPDDLEPNDTAEEATNAGLGEPVEAWLSYVGDQDWFEVDAFAGEALDIRVETDGGAWQPRVRVWDGLGALVADAQVAGGSLTRVVQLNGPGPHRLQISDDDDRDADPDAPYVLTVDTVVDLDPNEPNPSPVAATALGKRRCGGAWSEWAEESGTIGAPGDNDWFRLELENCSRGILEARLVLEQEDAIRPTLALVRPHAGTPCTVDDECHALNVGCQGDGDCRDWFETCLPSKQCAGASACLPEGICGGTQIAEHADKSVHFAVPIADEEAVYLRVTDFQSNDSAPGTKYAVRVRVRTDPDRREPDNPFYYRLLSSTPLLATTGPIEEVPVHECTHENGYADCCTTSLDPDTWNRGSIGYHNDIDHFRYRHPCPGESCLLRIHWEADAGPTDFLMGVYKGGSLWYDAVMPVSEKSWWPSRRGRFGGLGAGHKCFYAFSGHGGNPFWYRVTVRDWAKKVDFDPDQGYRFCVEKVATFCAEPCQIVHNGECSP